MEHTFEHRLSPEQAKEAANAALAAYQERFPKYEPRATWVSDRRAEVEFNAKGIRLRGAFEVRADSVTMELDVPMLFRPLKKVAFQIVEREFRAWEEKAERGELDEV